MAKIKLTYTTKFSLEVDNEEELQMVMQNMPWLRSQPGFTSGQSTVRHIEAQPIIQLGTRAQADRVAIIAALAECKTKTAAAKVLGITRATLYSKIDEYGNLKRYWFLCFYRKRS